MLPSDVVIRASCGCEPPNTQRGSRMIYADSIAVGPARWRSSSPGAAVRWRRHGADTSGKATGTINVWASGVEGEVPGEMAKTFETSTRG